MDDEGLVWYAGNLNGTIGRYDPNAERVVGGIRRSPPAGGSPRRASQVEDLGEVDLVRP